MGRNIWKVILFKLFAVRWCGLFAKEDSIQSYPTKEELGRAILVRPSNAWGYEMRRQKSIRIACLGGSNTEGRYPGMIDAWLKQKISPDSYALDLGASGQDLQRWLNLPNMGFEHQDYSLWPNLFSFESAVNCLPGTSGNVIMDEVMHDIIDKYERHGLVSPSFMIIEVILFMAWYDPYLTDIRYGDPRFNITSYEDRLAMVNSFEDSEDVAPYFGRSTGRRGMTQSFFARYYWIPFISWRDASFPSFIRHFLGFNQSVRWPLLTPEYNHISGEAHEILVNDIIGPFLYENFQYREADKEPLMNAFDNHKIRLYPAPKHPQKTLEEWDFTYGRTHAVAIVNVHPVPNWNIIEYKPDRRCYASTTKDSFTELRFISNKRCNNEWNCILKLSYLHSWNISRYGDIRCSVFQLPRNILRNESSIEAKQISEPVLIESNTKHNRDTTIHITDIASKLPHGHLELRCVKPDNRLACITRLALTAENEI
eukprot:gene4424-8809_t